MAGREADEDFDVEEEENIEKQLEYILHDQVRFQILFSMYLISNLLFYVDYCWEQ